ncbi:MAG: FecR domain-containing protein [Opitutales bacterium]
MKHLFFRQLSFGFSLSLLLFFLAPNASAQSPEIGAARVVKVEGSAFALPMDSEERVALQEGDSVQQRTTLVTGGKSRLVLLFSNGAAMTLGPDTSMSIEEYLHGESGSKKAEPNPSSLHLFLEYGETAGNVEALDESSDFTVRTPLGTAGIRGTTFRFSFDAEKVVLVVSNVDGTVEWGVGDDLISILAGRELTITGLIGDDGSIEILDISHSGIAATEIRRIVQSLAEPIFLRVRGDTPDSRLPFPLTPSGDDRIIISPSR